MSNIDQVIAQAQALANQVTVPETPEQIAIRCGVQHFPGFVYNESTKGYEPAAAVPQAYIAPAPAPQAYNAPAPQAYNAPVPQAYNAPVPTSTPAIAGKRLSLSETTSDRPQMAVDHFLKVEKGGILASFTKEDPRSVGIGRKYCSKAVIEIDFETGFALCRALRYTNAQGKTEFKKSYDGIVDIGGTPWSTCIAQAVQVDPILRQKQSQGKTPDYPSLDAAGKLLTPMVALDGTVVLEAGLNVGFSTSVMNFRGFERILRSLLATGQVVEEYTPQGGAVYKGTAIIELSHLLTANDGGTQYGQFAFTLLESAPKHAQITEQVPVIAPVVEQVADKPVRKGAKKVEVAAEEVPAAPPGFKWNAETGSFVPA